MILVDFNNLAYRALFVSLGINKGATHPEQYGGLCTHILLKSIRACEERFKTMYGDIVVCKDYPWTWRNRLYPFYKKQRKRDEHTLNWSAYWPFQKEQFAALKMFGYNTIEVENVEADDCIAVLSRTPNEKHLIVSQDKDFLQLVNNDSIHFYKPIDDEYITQNENRDNDLIMHILIGDKVDNIPSIKGNTQYSKEFLQYLQDNNLETPNIFGLEWSQLQEQYEDFFNNYSTPFALGNFGPKSAEKFIENLNENLDSNELIKKRFYENKTLIDLNEIPDEVVATITLDKVEKGYFDKDKAKDFCNKWNLNQLKELFNLSENIFNAWLEKAKN